MNDFLDDLIDKLDIGVVIIDINMNIVSWNQWMVKKNHIKKEDSIGKKIFFYAPKLKEKHYMEIIEDVIKTGNSRFLSGALHKNLFQNSQTPENDSIMQNLQISKLKENELLLIQVSDISSQYKKVQKMKNFIQDLEIENTEMKKVEQQTKLMALHDPLTGLPNRTFVMEKLEQWLEASKRACEKLGVCFIDIDYLKMINDTYGHQVGDEVLKLFSTILKKSIRKSDFVGRISGDEFIVILPNIADISEVEKIAKSIINNYKKPFMIENKSIEISCSIGISIYPENGISSKELLLQADKSLYEVKQSGRRGYNISKF